MVAGREKDYEFAAALIDAGLIDAGLIDPGLLAMRAEAVDVAPLVRRRLNEWIASRR